MVHPSLVLKVKKLDSRFAGGYAFKYCIEFNYKQHERFIALRNWCWETWGPSYELKFHKTENPEVWAWITDNYRTRIYFKSEQEVNWYKLRWE